MSLQDRIRKSLADEGIKAGTKVETNDGIGTIDHVSTRGVIRIFFDLGTKNKPYLIMCGRGEVTVLIKEEEVQ